MPTTPSLESWTGNQSSSSLQFVKKVHLLSVEAGSGVHEGCVELSGVCKDLAVVEDLDDAPIGRVVAAMIHQKLKPNLHRSFP